MRLSNRRLRRIIREEINNFLNEEDLDHLKDIQNRMIQYLEAMGFSTGRTPTDIGFQVGSGYDSPSLHITSISANPSETRVEVHTFNQMDEEMMFRAGSVRSVTDEIADYLR